MFRTERRIIIFNCENILNKLGKDKILIVILAGILLMVISIPVKDRQTVSENTTSNQESGEATQKMCVSVFCVLLEFSSLFPLTSSSE
jgi:hypothetical protein